MKRYILLLTMAVFTIMAISSCAMEDRKKSILVHNLGQGSIIVNQPQEVVQALSRITKVYIYPDPDNEPNGPKHIIVYPEMVCIKFGTNHSITWEKVGFEDSAGPEFIINFNKHGSPFRRENFDNANSNSGNVDKNPRPPATPRGVQRYDYQVVVPGYIPLDPIIIVWN